MNNHTTLIFAERKENDSRLRIIPSTTVFGEEYIFEKKPKNKNEWTISSIPHHYRYTYINFKALHPFYGNVWTDDLEKSISADSQEGLDNFLSFYPLLDIETHDL